MLAKFFNALVRFPFLVILVSACITYFLAKEASEKLFDKSGALIIDSSIEPFMSQESDSYSFFKKAREMFGSEDTIIVSFKAAQYDLAFFNMLERLEVDIKKELSGVKDITSLLNAPNPDGVCSGDSYFHKEYSGSVCESLLQKANFDLQCSQKKIPVLSSSEEGLGLDEELGLGLEEDLAVEEESVVMPTSSFMCTAEVAAKNSADILINANTEINKILQTLRDDKFVKKDLISEDGSLVALLINFELGNKTNEKELQDSLAKLLKSYESPTLSIAYAGQARQEFVASFLLFEDIQQILPISLALMALVLLLSFKSLKGVFLPLTIIVIGIIWTFGIFAIMGEVVNLVSVILGPLLVSVGSAYIIHVLNRYYQVAIEGGERKEVVSKTIEHVALPLVVTAITTLAGFAALTFSPTPAIVQMGIYSCVGIFVIIFLSLSFLPSLLLLLPLPKIKTDKKNTHRSWIDAALYHKSLWVDKHSKKFIYTWVGVVFLGFIGASQIYFDSNETTLSPELEISKDLKLIEDNLAGISTLRVVLSGEELLTAKTMYALDKLNKFILKEHKNHKLPHIQNLRIDKIYSPVDYLEHHRQGLDNLKDKEVITFFDDLKKKNGPKFLSDDKKYMQFNIRMTNEGTNSFLELKKHLEQVFSKELSHLQVKLTGSQILASESVDNIAKGQVKSILIALVVIFFILSAMFFSFKMGFLAIYPNIAAIGIFFGILGWWEVPIGFTVSIIAAIALGIGVDDTIHFLTHYNEEVQRTRNERKSSLHTLRIIGKPMVFTTIMLSSGFAIFGLSQMDSQATFGILTAITLLVCLITDLNFLPSIMAETRLITIWDYLKLNFDEKFIRSISLFDGMSVNETKLATLMAYSKELKTGELLFSEGDVSNEMYIVLEGKIELYLDERFHNAEHVLIQSTKGDMFGEMGLFREAKRSASARAKENTKLLILNQKVMKTLQKRYPEIAAKLFHNLANNLVHSINRTNTQLESALDKVAYTTQNEEKIFTSIFENAKPKFINWLKAAGEVKAYKKDEALFYKGDKGEFMAIVLEGAFDIFLDEGQKNGFDPLKTGDIVGEMTLLSEQLSERTASAIAIESSKALLIDKKLFATIMQTEPAVAAVLNYNIICILSDRLQQNNTIIYQ